MNLEATWFCPHNLSLMGKRVGGFLPSLTVSALPHVHKLQLWGWNIWLQIKSEWKTAKMTGWTVDSIWLHSLERRLGLWVGTESKEHELKGLAKGNTVVPQQQLNIMCNFQQDAVLHVTVIRFFIVTRINWEGLFEMSIWMFNIFSFSLGGN